jgi:branched-chain amino acid transport system substrate-binding protein
MMAAGILWAGLVLTALSACTNGSAGPGVQASPTPTGGSRTIAVLAPLTGSNAEQGRGLLASVRAIVESRAAALQRVGIVVNVIALDDRGQPSVAQQQATRVTDDPSVIAVIGSETSLVNEGVQPILNTAGLAMIAPGGGAVWLTERGRPPRRPFPTYFRLCAVDPDQGVAAATQALQQRARRAVVVSDGIVAHAQVGAAFVKSFRAGGGAATSLVLPNGESLVIAAPTIRRIAAASPQTLLLSTDPGLVPVIKDALAAVGSRPRVVTTMPPEDLLADPAQPKSWTGVVASTIGALPQTLPRAPTLVPTDPGAQGSGDVGIYAAAGHDAAALVLDALAQDPRGTGAALRAAVVASVGSASIRGVTGPVSFDRFGNVRVKPIGFFAYDGTAWVPQPAVIVGPAT